MNRLAVFGLVLCACGTLVDSRGKSGTLQLGPAGGVVEADFGVRVYLPPGALVDTVTISLTASKGAAPGAARSIDLAPATLQLRRPGVLTFRSPDNEKHKVARLNETWLALPGWAFEASGVSAPVNAFGTFGLVVSAEACSGALDEDGDGLTDCADPVCTGDVLCPLACTSNADCPCGSTCTGGGCSATRPRFCAESSDCGGLACATPTSRGASCGFLMCIQNATASTQNGLPDGGPTAGAADAGSDPQPVLVKTCSAADEECACEPCSTKAQCAGGFQCLEARRKGGRESCDPPRMVCQ